MTALGIIGYVFGSLMLASAVGAIPEFCYHWRRWREHLRDAARNDYEE